MDELREILDEFDSMEDAGFTEIDIVPGEYMAESDSDPDVKHLVTHKSESNGQVSDTEATCTCPAGRGRGSASM